jgi:pyruvate,orthophosphate dikinase
VDHEYQPIYEFSAEHCSWAAKNDPEAKKILGGKGAGLAMMAQAGLPVPPGFTITTQVCNQYRAAKNKGEVMVPLMKSVLGYYKMMADKLGYAPLVSVRSGAPVSMPGMMDTILNVGLLEETKDFWAHKIGHRAMYDSERRLVQMLGVTAHGVPAEAFEFQLYKVKYQAQVKHDTDLTAEQLKHVVERFKNVFAENTGKTFPDTLELQIGTAVMAVFHSWMSPRAIEYRKLNNISDDMGTAVTVQMMVFGNMGKTSGTGVLFTRNPLNGAQGMYGEFLENAQGEDVVAGIRTPHPVADMIGKWNLDAHGGDLTWPDIHSKLLTLCELLEIKYNDMVDIEFTVQEGKLYVLQSRSGKRSARAAFRIAVDMEAAGRWTRLDAFKKLTSEQFKTLRQPQIDIGFKVVPDFIGIAACPGVITAKPVFSSKEAVNSKEPCILVTHETTPNDIAGMAKAVGILTAMGGATSHAAVVARAMDKPCVVGTGATLLENAGKWEKVTIDGSTGRVWINQEVPVVDASDATEVQAIIDWSFELLGVCESVPVDLGTARPHRIMAAHWWGNEEVLNAVIDGVAAMPIRTHISMDVRGPKDFGMAEDDILNACFESQDKKTDPFVNILVNTLNKRAKEIEGMLIDSDGSSSAPKACPAEYAVFSVLGA